MIDFTPARLRDHADGMRQAFTLAMQAGRSAELAALHTADCIAAALRAGADAIEREDKLWNYTQHAANCAQTDWMARQKKRPMYPVTRDPMPPCTCGLDALRKEANRG